MKSLVGLVTNMRNLLTNNLRKKLTFHKPALQFIFLCFGGLFTYIFSKLLLLKPEGVYIGQANAWSDWVVHISITNIFAHKPISEWFLYHPFFADSKLTYGFLVHLITAFFVKAGLPLDIAFFIVSVILLFLLLTGLYVLYYLLSKSRVQSILGLCIFFTSSGMGIFRYLPDITIQTLLYPTKDYSRFIEYEWLAGNIPAALLIPQRAFFIGATIGVWVLNLLLIAIHKKKKPTQQKKILFIAGILAGILPIAHMHSFIAIVIITGIICVYHKKKLQTLLFFIVPATILSTLLYSTFIHEGIQIDSFMSILIGWTAPSGVLSWFIMWLNLWGTFVPSVIFALFYLKKNKNLQKYFPFYLGLIALFSIANLISFQPTKWDNTKLFAWVYLGFSILVAQLIMQLWNKSIKVKIILVILMITLSLTGAVEIMRILHFSQNTYLLSSNTEVQFAKKIRENTKTDAIFLTSTHHNHPIPLWASRPIFLGYLGWVRNFGFDDTLRKQQIHTIFSGEREADQIIIENNISYIYVGPKEKSAFSINQEYLHNFPIAFQNTDTTVYDVRQLWQ